MLGILMPGKNHVGRWTFFGGNSKKYAPTDRSVRKFLTWLNCDVRQEVIVSWFIPPFKAGLSNLPYILGTSPNPLKHPYSATTFWPTVPFGG